MTAPKTIEAIEWNDSDKRWQNKVIQVEEYHGFTECRRCSKPISHNVKTNGEFKVIYVRCACSKQDTS